MSKKIIISPQSQAMKVKEMIDKADAWDHYDVIIVRDEDYEEATQHLKEILPEGSKIKEVSLNEEKDEQTN